MGEIMDDVDELADAKRHFVLGEAAMINRMLTYDAAQAEASKFEVTPTAGMLTRSMIPLEIGQAMGFSEGQVKGMLFDARTVRDRAPLTWQRFQAGDFSFHVVGTIAAAINKLTQPESVTELDLKVGDYAACHHNAEVRAWLRRFIVRVEADATNARAEAERERRFVMFDHGDDGMSKIIASIPSVAAAAIERRLHKDARKLPKDGRTLVQKEADLLAYLLTSNEQTGEPAVNAEIAVVVDADVLAGARTGFGLSPDGAWVVPAEWIDELAQTGNTFWYRMVREPVTKDILTIDYRGRYAPDTLKTALFFLYGTCATPGCTTPAWKCEFDHIVPWPEGKTTASNIQPKSKAHHGQKGHGLVPKLRTPPGRSPKLPVTQSTDREPTRIDFIWTEIHSRAA